MPFVRSAYNYDAFQASLDSSLSCPEPSLAQQQFREDSDPNFIVKQFAKTGDLSPFIASKLPQSGDFTGISNYHDALNVVIAANDAFDSLPSKIRSRFNNDPSKLLDFVSDPSNRSEAISLGILDEDLSKGQPEPHSSKADPVGKSSTPKASTASKNFVSEASGED